MMYLRENSTSGKWRDQDDSGGTTAGNRQQEAMDLEDFYLNLKQFEITAILISDVMLYFCVVDICK